jgi:indole-3-glycerol phosphate synthase
MATRLDQIIDATRRRVAAAKSAANVRDMERRAQEHEPRGFRRQLAARAEASVPVIAELKKASPSKGLIRPDFDARALGTAFEVAGATALSVLTDEEFFQGSLENLVLASASTKLPCLRKDFIVDDFQLLEARANCADAVLLIVAALPQRDFVSLAKRAREWHLDVLCEVHDEDELRRAVDAGCDLIGVNSRDLRTFQVDLNTAFRLADKFPPNTLRVAESGIQSPDDITKLRAAGYHAFLIGESLMRAPKPGDALRALLTQSQGMSRGSKSGTRNLETLKL